MQPCSRPTSHIVISSYQREPYHRLRTGTATAPMHGAPAAGQTGLYSLTPKHHIDHIAGNLAHGGRGGGGRTTTSTHDPRTERCRGQPDPSRPAPSRFQRRARRPRAAEAPLQGAAGRTGAAGAQAQSRARAARAAVGPSAHVSDKGVCAGGGIEEEAGGGRLGIVGGGGGGPQQRVPDAAQPRRLGYQEGE